LHCLVPGVHIELCTVQWMKCCVLLSSCIAFIMFLRVGERQHKFMDKLKSKHCICVSKVVATSGEPVAWCVNQELNVSVANKGAFDLRAHMESSCLTKIWKPPLLLVVLFFYGR
jgi:hypothetical protein